MAGVFVMTEGFGLRRRLLWMTRRSVPDRRRSPRTEGGGRHE